MLDFLRTIGYAARQGQGSEWNFDYDAEVGVIPLARIDRRGFGMHLPHATWGNKFEAPGLDMVKRKLAGVGVTYELLAEFYQL